MNKLKELNLLSVINNMDEKQLSKLFDNISDDKIFLISNLMYKKRCNTCDIRLTKHRICESCSLNKCIVFEHKNIFYHTNMPVEVCLHCLRNEEFRWIKNKCMETIETKYYIYSLYKHSFYNSNEKQEIIKYDKVLDIIKSTF